MTFLKRIGNILLLIRVLIRAIFSGRADKIPKTISRIIIVPTGKLGDVVCTTPVLRAVRKHFPQGYVIVVGDSKLHKQILLDSGLVDEYSDNAVSADVALVTGPTFELTAPLYLTGIPLIIAPKVIGGFSSQVTKPYRILTYFLKTYVYRMKEYAPRERLRCLEPLGIIYEDTTKYLGFSESADTKIQQFLSIHDIDLKKDFVIGVTPTAGHKIKEWPEKCFAQVIDYLVAKYKVKIIILGGPKDREKVEKTKSYLNQETKIIETTSLNIDELKALIAKLKLFISVDTGPIYIAEAFGVPTIDITGPIDEKEQPPQGPFHRNVVPPQRLRPELFVLNAKSYNREEALRQVKSITVSMVTDEIDSLLSILKMSE